MKLHELFVALGEESFRGQLRGISLGTLRTYKFFDRLKLRLHLGKLNTEALRAVIAHGFDAMGLHRIEGQHYVENPASGRVMAKAGMTREGLLRGYVLRDGVPRDNVLYAILGSEPRG